MAVYKFSVKPQEDCARAVGRALPISTKASIEVLFMVRGKPVSTAVAMLEEVEKLKRPVPYLRAYKDVGHRRGNMTSGRFPQKAAGHIKNIILSAKANAEDRGLNAKELVLIHASAQQGGHVARAGRHGRSAKRTHIEIMVKVVPQEKRSAKKRTAKKPVGKKPEAKPVEEKKVEPKPVEEKKVEEKLVEKVEEKLPTAETAKPEAPEEDKQSQSPNEDKKEAQQ